MSYQVDPQRDCVVVICIACGEHERDVSFARRVHQWLPCLWFLVQFSKVTLLKLFPPGRIVSKPFPQRTAWRNGFSPAFHLQSFFRHSARPQIIDEKSGSIVFPGGFINAFDENHIFPPTENGVNQLKSETRSRQRFCTLAGDQQATLLAHLIETLLPNLTVLAKFDLGQSGSAPFLLQLPMLMCLCLPLAPVGGEGTLGVVFQKVLPLDKSCSREIRQ